MHRAVGGAARPAAALECVHDRVHRREAADSARVHILGDMVEHRRGILVDDRFQIQFVARLNRRHTFRGELVGVAELLSDVRHVDPADDADPLTGAAAFSDRGAECRAKILVIIEILRQASGLDGRRGSTEKAVASSRHRERYGPLW